MTTGRFALWLGLLVAISYPGVLAGFETFALRDFGLFGYPLAAHHRESFWNGEIPHWNPLNECGIPFLAQWNTLVLYPGSLLYLLLPLPWSVSLFCLLHLYLGGLGYFVLAREWRCPFGAAAFAGIAYTFNGFLQNSLMWPNNIAALGLFPWVVWSVQRYWTEGRRAFIPASLISTMQMLTGAPEIILFTWCFVGTLWIGELLTESRDRGSIFHQLRRLASVIGITAMLAAAQLLPFFSLLSLADRSSQFEASAWAATPFAWLNLLLPLFDTMRSPIGCVTHHSQAWTHSIYAGTAVCALALLALIRRPIGRVHVLLVMLLGFVSLSFGKAGAPYEWLAAVLPLENLRFPVKFLVPCSFVLPLAAAVGIREWLTNHRVAVSRMVIYGIIIGVMMVAGGCLDVLLLNPGRQISWLNYHLPRLASLVVILSALYLLRRHPKTSARWVPATIWAVLLITCWADLRFHQPQIAPSLPANRLASPSAPASEGRSVITADTMRIVGEFHLPSLDDTLRQHRKSLYCNLNLLSGDATAAGFYSLYLPRYRMARRTLYDGFYDVHKPMADFLGIDRVGRYEGGLLWQPRATALPLATVGQKPLFGEAEQLLSAMHSSRFDPRQMVLFESGHEEAIAGEAAPGSTVSIVSRSSGQIELEVNATAPAIVVIAQTHHPNWRAFVNDKETPIHMANHAFQAVDVPPGTSRLKLEYQDPAFRKGLILSLLGSLIVLITWILPRPSSAVGLPDPPGQPAADQTR